MIIDDIRHRLHDLAGTLGTLGTLLEVHGGRQPASSLGFLRCLFLPRGLRRTSPGPSRLPQRPPWTQASPERLFLVSNLQQDTFFMWCSCTGTRLFSLPNGRQGVSSLTF